MRQRETVVARERWGRTLAIFCTAWRLYTLRPVLAKMADSSLQTVQKTFTNTGKSRISPEFLGGFRRFLHRAVLFDVLEKMTGRNRKSLPGFFGNPTWKLQHVCRFVDIRPELPLRAEI